MVPPAIRMNLLAEREDVEALARAVQRTREIIATEPIASTVEREHLPAPDTDLETYIRETAITTTTHPAAASRWAARPTARSTKNCGSAVWTTSASPMPRRSPQIPRANTNAPSIMIGERCADFLLGGVDDDSETALPTILDSDGQNPIRFMTRTGCRGSVAAKRRPTVPHPG